MLGFEIGSGVALALSLLGQKRIGFSSSSPLLSSLDELSAFLVIGVEGLPLALGFSFSSSLLSLLEELLRAFPSIFNATVTRLEALTTDSAFSLRCSLLKSKFEDRYILTYPGLRGKAAFLPRSLLGLWFVTYVESLNFSL